VVPRQLAPAAHGPGLARPAAPSRSDASAASGRLTALDGLRGLAALVVVLHHCLLTDPRLAAPYADLRGPRFPGVDWWLTDTPLHLIWAGPEAVIVFFVLSGFVLVRPLMSRRFAWRAYYPSRLVRLYLPAWGALMLAVGFALAVPRTVSLRASWWLNFHDTPLGLRPVLHAALLIHGGTWLVSPLWSLKWEVIFSLALPLVAFAVRYGALLWLQVVGLLAMIGLGAFNGNQPATYLPMFVLGALLARHEAAAAARLASLSRRGAWPLALGAVLLVTLPWTLEDANSPWLLPLQTAGAVLIVALFAFLPAPQRFGNVAAVQWLGKRSFSLYLVHEPLVVSVALLLGPRSSPAEVVAISLPLALVLSELFFRCLEAPTHRAARAIARAGRRRPAPAGAELAVGAG
jgi:peptidoglycan/LPS O-acetylase OafA/YrhL